ncbi:pirin family protein [Alteromonas sp. CYL-A6]|uniref:pirin family protein n=1 Tax=Alteromonas nitratireducens TaxID=3390813 RepID=UPI0034C42EF8
MQYIRKSHERGGVDFGWLQSQHSFSFGSYFDPNHMGFSVLRVINDDWVKPGKGFGTHGHKDMEIISYVVEGALKHKDSTGNDYVIPAGDVQRMSAGKGIMHSEFNPSDNEEVNFLQIWITPNVQEAEPGYEQKTIQDKGKLTPLVTPNGEGNSLSINQDASMYRVKLVPGESLELTTGERFGYLHTVKGQFTAVSNDSTVSFGQGDAFGAITGQTILITADTDVEALWFDLPPVA